MEHRFSLRLKSPHSNIEIVVCKEEGLEIEVIQQPRVQPGSMTLVMAWEQEVVHFNILGDIQPNWDRPLFEEAVNWFVDNQMQRQPSLLTGMESFQSSRWIDEEEGYEQTEPWSEEELAFQRHISDEQRSYDISLKVEAMLYRK